MRYLRKFSLLFIPVLLFFFCLFTSCKDEFSDNPNHKLSFSVDTLYFDTVFSTIGSATKRIMVHNKNKDALRISQIELVSGSRSAFKINVNGENNVNHQFFNIEIQGKDSLYIFVGVKVEEMGKDSAVIKEESLRFVTNGNTQEVILSTVAQDVEILRGRTIYNDTILTGTKPYLIYDSLIVMPGKTLKLEAGCRLYFHKDAYLFIWGYLNAEGTRDNPITMRGDRFDQINFSTPVPYNDVAGQWNGVYLAGNDGKHILKHVNMNSGIIGIRAINTEEDVIPSQTPLIEIINCRIRNFSYRGLDIVNFDLAVINSEISNTGDYTVFLNGGKHTFIHTTIANYFNNGKVSIQSSSRPGGAEAKPALMIENVTKSAPMETTFINSVVMGSMGTEFSLATRFPEEYNGIFRNSYIRRSNIYELPQFRGIRWYEKNDIVFRNIYLNYEDEAAKRYDFSPAPFEECPLRHLGEDIGLLEYDLSIDLKGNPRPTESPDAGAYQWLPAEE